MGQVGISTNKYATTHQLATYANFTLPKVSAAMPKGFKRGLAQGRHIPQVRVWDRYPTNALVQVVASRS